MKLIHLVFGKRYSEAVMARLRFGYKPSACFDCGREQILTDEDRGKLQHVYTGLGFARIPDQRIVGIIRCTSLVCRLRQWRRRKNEMLLLENGDLYSRCLGTQARGLKI